jgi:hypothetical protein
MKKNETGSVFHPQIEEKNPELSITEGYGLIPCGW